MRELCRRNGVVLPSVPRAVWPADRPAATVAVICNDQTAGAMLTDLQAALVAVPERVSLVDESELPSADRVLLLLSSQVLAPDSASLRQLEATIRLDKASDQDRIVAVFSTAAGWEFGCEEQTTASAEVQACLNDHEAVCFRPRDPGGPHRHEFQAMTEQVLGKLGVATRSEAVLERQAPRVTAAEVEPEPEPQTQEQPEPEHEPEVDTPESMVEQLAEKDALITAQEAEIATLRARLAEMSSDDKPNTALVAEEGVPPARGAAA